MIWCRLLHFLDASREVFAINARPVAHTSPHNAAYFTHVPNMMPLSSNQQSLDPPNLAINWSHVLAMY
jgi:hypothetical protein